MVIAETERLRLRHFHIVDGEAMDCVFGDPEVMHYGPGAQTPEWVRKWLRGCLEDYHQKCAQGLCRQTTQADSTSMLRSRLGPRRVMWPKRLMVPLSICLGTRPA